MHCCEKCFKDSEIKAIIRGNNTRGKCDFCHSDNVFVYDLDSNEYLRDDFESLLDVYTPINEMGRNYPKERADLIKNVLCSQWSIFNLNPDGVYKFLISLLPEKYNEQPSPLPTLGGDKGLEKDGEQDGVGQFCPSGKNTVENAESCFTHRPAPFSRNGDTL